VTWLLIPACLLVAVALTFLAGRALREPEAPPEPPCEHPWFIDGRCIVCGHPR
jgi:hypothetical protein